MPLSNCAEPDFRWRSHNCGRPSPNTTTATFSPSGEIAKEKGSSVAGVVISSLRSGAAAPGRRATARAAAATIESTATADIQRYRSRPAGRPGACAISPDPARVSAIHRSSRITSPALCQRSSGSFARHRATT